MLPRQGSSGMGERKKRASLASLPLSPIASSSSYNPIQTRSESPPASAYFPLLSADSNARLRPLPDAEAHFAYSTTLRRHQADASTLASTAQAVNAEASSLWSRAVGAITGQQQESDYGERMENGQAVISAQSERNDQTASARFAHYSVEVGP
jgi:Ca2+-transporting ATPase